MPDWSEAIAHLSRDKILRAVIRKAGPCTLSPRRDYFVRLCSAILSQQISTKVARVIFARFAAKFPGKRPTPQRVLDLLQSSDESAWSGCGLSRQKRLSLIDLAQHFLDGRIPSRKLRDLPAEEIIQVLSAVRGIGRWTAEMFLIFVLNRPDVWPVDDLGLQTAVRDRYGLKARPSKIEMLEIGEAFRPFRSVATWYLWRSLV